MFNLTTHPQAIFNYFFSRSLSPVKDSPQKDQSWQPKQSLIQTKPIDTSYLDIWIGFRSFVA